MSFVKCQLNFYIRRIVCAFVLKWKINLPLIFPDNFSIKLGGNMRNLEAGTHFGDSTQAIFWGADL
jgi:hypothetical protein